MGERFLRLRNKKFKMGIATAKLENEYEIAKIVACKHSQYQLPIGKVVVRVDPEYYRPKEVDLLRGDPTNSKTKLVLHPKYNLIILANKMGQFEVGIFKYDLS